MATLRQQRRRWQYNSGWQDGAFKNGRMGKCKTEMKLIENQKGREKVFEKRRKNLLKMANELSVLCDIKMLLIIYEQNKQKSEIWPNDNGDAEQIIKQLKQQRATKKAFDSFSRKKIRVGNKFAISDHSNMIDHYSENQLQNLIFDLDAEIAAVENVLQSKQVLTRESKSPNMPGDCQKTGPLNKGKGKEVVISQEPANTEQHRSFQTRPDSPQKNVISYPEFDQSCSSNVPYVPLPIDYVGPSPMQQPFIIIGPSPMQQPFMDVNSLTDYHAPNIYTVPPYMNDNSLMDYYVPNIYTVPPYIYHPMMPGFPSEMNTSD
ncbi:hypothetical protein V6N13_079925 [Hibiscus sabdariffa]|uniref:MADS-box domain-containing protein n=1 Tax=Hibiscus sabdariffa TaxID=183260 RepID=A0ABR2RTC7_9ROSI